MRAPGVRWLLLLDLAAAAAAAAALLLGIGLPLIASRRVTPTAFALLVAAGAALMLLLGAALLFRAVARPVDRLLGAAERLAPPGGGPGVPDLPILGESGGPALSRAAVAFERVASALVDERARLAAKVDELTRANRELAAARETLLRSERLATVGRLAAGVAHEVGNPLGAISGYVDLARSRVPPGAPPELADWLERIGVEVRRIDRIIRELLEFGRPAPPRLAAIDLAPAVDASLRLARVQPRFREVQVETDLPPDLPRVLADEHSLAQVLLNLLLNAGDAQGGAGAVRIAARGGGASVRLEVADRGPGIPPADLARIFDPFFTTKEPGQGAGLGLAICHRIMESFGGDISADNAPQGGAVMTLVFRVAGGTG